jgi:hypothetical protein
MNFASDNAAGIAPEILAAVARANEGPALAYGHDDWTARLERRFADMFERDVAVFLVATGTAANALALAHLTPPWGAVLCHDESHIATDECGAPEFFGGGIKLIGLAGAGGKIAPETLARALDGQWGGPHHVTPAVLSLSQASEAGTIYRMHEMRRLAEMAHARGLAVHVDGARLANALVRMNASLAEATWKAGVDALSFGATKGGALAAEAVVFLDPARATNCRSGASAPAISSPSTDFWPCRWKPIAPMISGSSSRATPMPWPTAWRRGLHRSGSSRSGRSKRTKSLSPCRRAWTRGSSRKARSVTRGARIRSRTASPCRTMLR